MIVYSEEYLKHHMEGHPEKKERLTRTVSFLKEKGVFEKVPLKAPIRAGADDILRVHSKDHFEEMRAKAKMGLHVVGDTYFTLHTYDAALLAAGGGLTCIKDGVRSGFALVRPPGHHATRNAAMGFCIFNNIAIGAAYARKHGYTKVAILDFDLHHGNGTQEIFYEDDVLYISLHQWPHYPGTGAIEETGSGKGEGYTINIPLPAGTADKGYNHALDEVVFPMLKAFEPEILFVSAGYDGHFTDPLGGFSLSSNIYLRISRETKGLAKKVVFALEGGYNLTALPHCVYASLQGLFGLEGEAFDTEQSEDRKVSKSIENRIKTIRRLASEHWKV